MGHPIPLPRLRFFNAAGLPLAGGKLYTYAAGTSTPLQTYTDSSLIGVNTNPIILNSNGECDVWIDALVYKVVLTDANDVVLFTEDGISTIGVGEIKTPLLADGILTADAAGRLKMADSYITINKMGPNSVGTSQVVDGSITAAKIPAGGITRDRLSAAGPQISAASGIFSTTSTSTTAVPNLSVTITTSGGPVVIALQSDGGSGDASNFNVTGTTGFGFGYVAFFRGATLISKESASSYAPSGATTSSVSVPVGSFRFLDLGATAGAHTYTVSIQAGSATSSCQIDAAKLVVIEI